MIFSLGDILIKVDYRATADTQTTRHHVMLVLGTSPKGNPIVAHMLGNPHFKLIKEELMRGKELELIHCAWSDETKKIIYQAAIASCEADKFVLTDNIVQEQREAVSQFRPTSSLEADKKLAALHAEFGKLAAKGETRFTPQPNVTTIMSCHEWVLSVIHYACQQTKQPIPRALQIPPHLAWADRLHSAAKNDKTVACFSMESFYAMKNKVGKEYKAPPMKLSKSIFGLFRRCCTEADDIQPMRGPRATA